MCTFRVRLTNAVAFALACSISVHAAIIDGPKALSNLAWRADTIVLGKVLKISSEPSGERYVAVRVEETWKGPAIAELKFFISNQRLGDDATDAKLGESVVLFLQTPPSLGKLVIIGQGTGRMLVLGPIDKRVVLLTLPPPDGMQVIPTTVPSGGTGRGVLLDDFKSYISTLVHETASP